MPQYLPLPDGTSVTVREGETPAQAWARAQRMYPEAFGGGAQPQTPVKKPSSVADLGYSALSGIGSLMQFPGQVYGLATGDMDNSLNKMGQSVREYAQSQQSEGLKQRQAAQQKAIADASKEGFLSEAGTAIGSTLKDPVLLGNFIAENIPNMIPGFGIGRGTVALGTRALAKQVAAQGLEGEAKAAAIEAGTKALAKKAEALAVGTAVTQQGADVGAQAYADVYKKLKEQGASDEDAAAQALSLARSAGASGAVISYLSSRLPGARALEKAFVGKGAGSTAAFKGAIKGALGEGISEGIEEGGGQLSQNAAVSTVDPTRNIMSGVGQAAGLGTVLGGVLGGGAGALNANVEARQEAERTARAAAEQQAREEAELEQRKAQPGYAQGLLDEFSRLRGEFQQASRAASAKLDKKSDTYFEDLEAQKVAKKAQKDIGEQVQDVLRRLNEVGISPGKAAAAAQKAAGQQAAGVAPGQQTAATTPPPTGEEAPNVSEPAPFTAPQPKTDAPFYKGLSREELAPHIQNAQATMDNLLQTAKQSSDPDDLLETMEIYKSYADLLDGLKAEDNQRVKDARNAKAADTRARNVRIKQETPLATEHAAILDQLAAEQAKDNPDPTALFDLATKLKASHENGGAAAYARMQGRAEPTGPIVAEESGEPEAQEIGARHAAAMDYERRAPTGPIRAEDSGEPEAMAIQRAREEAQAAAERLRALQEKADQARRDFAAGKRAPEPTDSRGMDQADMFAENKPVTEDPMAARRRADLQRDLDAALAEKAAKDGKRKTKPTDPDYVEVVQRIDRLQQSLARLDNRGRGPKGDLTPDISSAFDIPEGERAKASTYATGQRSTAATRESLQTQIDRLPQNMHPDDAALVGRIQDNLAFIATRPEQAEAVRDWLYRKAQGPQQVLRSTDGPLKYRSPGYKDAARGEDLAARDIEEMLDGWDRSGRSESETAETLESVEARNRFAKRKAERTSFLQQRIADIHNFLTEDPEVKRYRNLYSRILGAIENEAARKARVERLDGYIADTEAHIKQLDARRGRAESREDLDEIMGRMRASAADLQALRTERERANEALLKARDNKTKDRTALYANSKNASKHNEAFATLEKYQAELAQLAQESGPKREMQTTRGGVQSDMFPEIPGQGIGDSYVPRTRSDISAFPTGEQFRDFMATGANLLREAAGLKGITAEKGYRLLAPIRERLENLRKNAAAAYKALQEKNAATEAQRAELQKRRDEAAGRLNRILDSIGVQLAPLEIARNAAREPLLKLQMELADLLNLRNSRDEQLLSALKTLDDIAAHRARYEDAKTSGATEAELGELRVADPAAEAAAVARVNEEIDTLLENAPAQMRAMNRQRKALEERIAEAQKPYDEAQAAYAEAAAEIGRFFHPEKRKARQQIGEAKRGLAALPKERPAEEWGGREPRARSAVGTQRLGDQTRITRAAEERGDNKSEEQRDLESRIADIESRIAATDRNPPVKESTRAERDALSALRSMEEQERLEQVNFFSADGKPIPFERITFGDHRATVEQQQTASGTAKVYGDILTQLRAREAGGEENPTIIRDDGKEPITIASAEAMKNRADAKVRRLNKLLDVEGNTKKADLDADVDRAQKKTDEWAQKSREASTALGQATRALKKDPTNADLIEAQKAATRKRDAAKDMYTQWRNRLATAKNAQTKGPGISGMQRTVLEPKVLESLKAKYVSDPNYEPRTPEEAKLMEDGALPLFRKSVLMRKVSSAAGHGFRTSSPESRGQVRQLWLTKDGKIKLTQKNEPATRTIGPHENPINKPIEVRSPDSRAPLTRKEQQEANRIAREIGPIPPRAPKPQAEETVIPGSDALKRREAEEEDAANTAARNAEEQRAANEAAAAARGRKGSRLVESSDVPVPKARGKKDKATQAIEADPYADDELSWNDWDNNFLRGTSGPNDTPLGMGSLRALGRGDLRTALAQVAANSKNPIAKRLAAQYAALVGNVRVHLVDEMPGSNPDAPGGTTRNGMNVLLNRNTGLSEETLLHEVAHALTIHNLSIPDSQLTPEQRAAKREIEAMHEEIKGADALDNDVVKDDDIKEFVAESYGSNQVQSYMKGQDWKYGATQAGKAQYAASTAAGRGKLRSMWDAFKAAVMRFIKAPMPPSGPMQDRFLELADKFLRTPQETDVATRGTEISNYRDPLSAALKRGFSGDRSLPGIVKENKDSLFTAIRQNIADQRAALRDAVALVGTKDEKTAAAYTITMLDSTVSNTMTTLSNGAFKLDSKGNFVGGKNKSFVDVLNEIAKFPGIKGNEALNLFHMQRVANRADAMPDGWRVLAGSKAAEWKKKAQLVRNAIAANPELKAAVDRANKVYNEYNRGKIELLRDTYALPEDVVQRMLADKDYVPFYRQHGDSIKLIMPDGHPYSVGDIRTNPMLRSLKGGDETLLNFVDSEVKNAHLLTQLAVENKGKEVLAARMEMLGATRKQKQRGVPTMRVRMGKAPRDANAIEFRVAPTSVDDNGDRHLILDTEGTIAENIPTALLTQAFAGAYATQNLLTDMSHAVSGLLRTAVTRFPAYTIRQLFREPFSASVQGSVRSSPPMAIIKSIWEYGKIMANASEDAKTLQRQGIVESNVFSGYQDLDKVARQITGGSSWWGDKIAYWLDKSAIAADTATRVQAYRDAKAAGGSEQAALLHAREMQNFSRHGSAAWVQFLGHTIPFFNSSIQSMATLLRAAHGKMPAEELLQTRQKFVMRAAGMVAMALYYYSTMSDDPEWLKLPLRDKISYIHLPFEMGGERIKLPAPFEVGMYFYSLPIAYMEHMRQELTPEEWKAVRTAMMNQLPGGGAPLPQIAKLPIELATNYNLTFGSDIVSQSKQNLPAELQYGSSTSEMAKRAGEVTGVSPMKIDYAMSQLIGGWAKIIGGATDKLFQKAAEADISEPTGKLSENPIYGSFFQSTKNTADIGHVYEVSKYANSIKSGYDELVKEGNFKAAQQYHKEHALQIAMAPALGKMASELSNLSTMEKKITNMDMPQAQKDAALERIKTRRKEMAAIYGKAITRAFPDGI